MVSFKNHSFRNNHGFDRFILEQNFIDRQFSMKLTI